MILKIHPAVKRIDQNCDVCWAKKKQGRIHGNPVVDGWAGAVMLKQLGIQKNL